MFSGAKHKHQQQFQKQGKAINDKVRLYSVIGRALLEAKESGSDPYAAIEAVIPSDEFTEKASARPSCWPGRKASTTCTGRRELRHPAPLHAGLAGGAGTARRAGRARRAGSRADPA
ncbi:hypothetical protein [Enterobacter cloacae]|uniref:hypothetical protein n=1 Tax=Enterobacter cloacae TaxID=550 RepID=UPI003890ADB9